MFCISHLRPNFTVFWFVFCFCLPLYFTSHNMWYTMLFPLSVSSGTFLPLSCSAPSLPQTATLHPSLHSFFTSLHIYLCLLSTSFCYYAILSQTVLPQFPLSQFWWIDHLTLHIHAHHIFLFVLSLCVSFSLCWDYREGNTHRWFPHQCKSFPGPRVISAFLWNTYIWQARNRLVQHY